VKISAVWWYWARNSQCDRKFHHSTRGNVTVHDPSHIFLCSWSYSTSWRSNSMHKAHHGATHASADSCTKANKLKVQCFGLRTGRRTAKTDPILTFQCQPHPRNQQAGKLEASHAPQQPDDSEYSEYSAYSAYWEW
jgi:hypothetical protein